MDEEIQASTTAFFTLDAFDGDLASPLMAAIEQAMNGDEQEWNNLVEAQPTLRERLVQQGIETPSSFATIQWDPAMILFTSCVELTTDGRPLPLGETATRRGILWHGCALFFLEHFHHRGFLHSADLLLNGRCLF